MRRAIVLAVVMALSACGGTGARTLDVAGTTTSTSTTAAVTTTAGSAADATTTTTTPQPVAARKAQCASESVDTYDYTHDPDRVNTQQNDLRSDMETVQSYGQQHAEEFTSVRFENHPTVRIIATFTAHLDQHRAALRRAVGHPDAVDVDRGVQSERDARAMQKSVGERAGSSLRGSWTRGSGLVEVNLAPTAAGRDVAAGFQHDYADRVCILLANHPYPKGSTPDESQCTDHDVPAETVPGVMVELRLDAAHIGRGDRVTGVAHVSNHSDRRVEYFGGTDVSGDVVRPGTSHSVGSLLGVFHDLAGRNYVAEPGGFVDVPVVGGTDDCRADADYTLPAGRYGVVVFIKAFGRSNEVPLDVD